MKKSTKIIYLFLIFTTAIVAVFIIFVSNYKFDDFSPEGKFLSNQKQTQIISQYFYPMKFDILLIDKRHLEMYIKVVF